MDWAKGWYPEIRAACLASLVLSLLAPPWAMEDGQGGTVFLGWHSLLTQSVGYLSVARLVLFWLLVIVLAACTQLLGELRLATDASLTDTTFFGHRLGNSAPWASPATKVGLVLILLAWLLACRMLFGPAALFGLESHLGFFLGSVLQLVVLSRALVWISREPSHLRIAYAVLTVVCFGWDLRLSPTPSLRVGGLAPIALCTGYLLYRFDLRFAVSTVVPNAIACQPTPADDGAEQSSPAFQEKITNPEPELEPDFEPNSEPEHEPEPEPEPSLPKVEEDPYDRYRPKL